MAEVNILNNIVPEELVEEAKAEYENYIKDVPEDERKDLETYVYYYTTIFLAEEEIAIKEKYLEILKKEIVGTKKEVESSKNYINLKSNPTFKEDENIYSNLTFKDVLEILLDNEYKPFSTEEQLLELKKYYFNNIRNIEKEYNFLIEVNNIVKAEEESEEGIAVSLLEFAEFINNIYYK